MSRSFTRLKRVLDLEAQQGYQDKAVVGGIRQFAVYWVEQARDQAVDEADRAFVEQVAEVLTNYNRLPGTEARAAAITDLLARIQQRDERLGSAAQPQAAPRRDPPAQKAKPRPRERREPPPPKPRPVVEEVVEEPLPDVPADPEGLAQPVTALKGVGPKIAEKIDKLGPQTVLDMLYLFPRRYDDYTLMKPINKLVYGEVVTIIGTVWQVKAKRTRNNRTLTQAVISDGTGKVEVTWFNQPWLAKNLPTGKQIVISGKVDQFLGRPVFNSPDWEPLELEPLRTRRIVPIYPLTEGLGAGKMRDIMKNAAAYWALRVPEPLPEDIRKKHKLMPISQALRQMHFPDSHEKLHQANRRLVFDELFLLQLGMQSQRRQWRSIPGIPLAIEPGHYVRFRNALPFRLTGAQKRVIEEIMNDLRQDEPMNRLLQGDVGSGKTAVAAAAMFVTTNAAAQAAIMAPTSILAEQHYQGLSGLLGPLGVETALLTGSTPAAEKERIYIGLADGTIPLVIGTHALIQEGVQFQNLALAIIDEQHRFGVDQRAALRDKGPVVGGEQVNPHLLVMSATPIPRTLALSLYGDLDISILDEMPPGRQEIKTRWLRASERERAYNFIRKQVKEGRQAYIIFPLVEESDNLDEKAAVDEYKHLQQDVFPNLKLGLVHGRLKANEKEEAMRAFNAGETQVLVATSVIEVGVDVPNSTVMVVEGANRFGLAQLHQFRGRVGRGEHQSYCVLIAGDTSADAEERLQALEKSNDGFYLAEKDLELRGPGEFFGRRQSGIPELQLASLLDSEMVAMAQDEASQLFQKDPELQEEAHAALRDRVDQFWQKAADVS